MAVGAGATKILIEVGTDVKQLNELPASVQRVILQVQKQIDNMGSGLSGAMDKARAAGERAAEGIQKIAPAVSRASAAVDEFGARAAAAGAKAKAAADASSASWRDMGGKIAGAGASLSAGLTAPIAGALRAGIAFDDLKQRALIGFETMMGSADQAKSHLSALLEYAKATPFEASSLITASQKLQAMGIDGTRVIPIMSAIGDNVAAVGGGAEVLGRVTMAIGQIQTAGKLAGGELRQLSEAGIPMIGMLAEKLGKTTAEVKGMVEDGAISAETAIAVFMEGTAKRFGGVGAMMAAQSQTFSGLMSTVKDTVQQTLGDVAAPLFDYLSVKLKDVAAGLERFSSWWMGLSEPVKNAALAFGLVLAAIGPIALAAGAVMMVMSPMVGIVAGIGVAIAVLAAAWAGNWGGIRDATLPLLDKLQAGLGAVAGIAQTYLLPIITALGGLLGGALATVLSKINGALDAAVLVWDVLTGKLSAADAMARGASQGMGMIEPIILTIAAAVAVVMVPALFSAVAGFFTFAASAVVAWATAAAPVVLVIAAIAAAGAAVVLLAKFFIKHWTDIKATVSGAVSAIKTTVSDGWASITGAWSTGVSAVKTFAADMAADVSAKHSATASWAQSRTQEMWQFVQSKWSAGVAFVKMMGKALWADITATWSGIKATVTALASALWGWLVSSFELVKSTLINGVMFIANAFKTAWAWIVTTVSTIVSKIVNWLKDKWAWLGNTLGSIMARVADLFGAAWTWIHNTVGGIATRIVNAVSRLFHGLGRTLALIWEKVGDLFNAAWEFIVGVFRKYAGPIVSGVRNAFAAVVQAIANAMSAAGGIVQRAVEWILAKIQAVAGVLGAAFSGMINGAINAVRSGMSDLSSYASGVIASIRGGAGDAMDFFGSKIAAGRARLSGLFSGSAPQTADPGQAARQSMERQSAIDGGGDISGIAGGGGADLSGLAGAGEKAGSGAFQAPDGMSGRDADDSEWYIDPATGKKMYTSGPKFNRQQAQLAGIDAKKQEAEAKRAAAKAKLASGGKEADVATTIANIAEKVSSAVQAGLDAIQSLTDADLPGRDLWQPKLDAVMVFISTSLSAFDGLGAQLLEHIGPLDDGAQLMDTVKVKAIAGVASLTGGLLETMGKASTFLQGLVKAKWPAAGQIEAAFVIVVDTLRRVRDQGVELAGVFGEGPKKEGESDPLARFAAVGAAMNTWSDLWSKITDGAIRMGASAKELAAAPAAMASAEAVLDELQRYTRGMVTGLQAAIPDEDGQQAALFASRMIGTTFGVWADLMVKLGDGARSLADLPRIPANAAQMAGAFLEQVGEIIRAFVVPLQKAIPTKQAQTDALDLAAHDAETLTAMLGPFERLASFARSLRSVLRIPTDAAPAVGAFLEQVGAIMRSFVGPLMLAFPDPDDARAALDVVSADATTLGLGVELVDKAAAAMRALVDLPVIPEGTLPRVQATMAAIALMLSGLVQGVGPDGTPYNLLKDIPTTTANLGVVQNAVATTSAGVALISDITKLGQAIADQTPFTQGDVQRALDNAAMVRDLVVGAATAYADALERAGEDWQDVQERVGPFAAALTATSAAFDVAAKVKVGSIRPISIPDAEQAIVNAIEVDGLMRQWGDFWRAGIERAGLKVADVVAASAVFAGQLKTVAEAFTTSASIKIGEVQPLDVHGAALSMDNALVLDGIVQRWGAAWERAILAAGERVAEVTERTKAFGEQIKASVELVDVSAKFSLADIEPVSEQMVSLAMSNADAARYRVQLMADAWVRRLEDAGRTVEDVVAENEAFQKVVGGAIDLVSAGAALAFKDVKVLSAVDVDRIMANILLSYEAISSGAKRWAEGLVEAGRDMAAVVTENESFSKVAGGAADVLAKGNAALQAIAAQTPPTNLREQLRNLSDQLVFIVLELATAFDTVERQRGRLEKAGKMAAVLGPAADALSKTFDMMSLDKLLNQPLLTTKVRSGWMSEVARKRMDALAVQIRAGITRTVQVLIDALRDISIPSDLAAGLDQVAAVYERLVGLFERIRDIVASGVPGPDEIRAIVSALNEIFRGAGGLGVAGAGVPPGAPAPGAAPGGGGSGGGGGGSGGGPGGGSGGGSGGPHEGGPPPGMVQVVVPPANPTPIQVLLDSDEIAAKIVRKGHDLARLENLAPLGG